MDKLADLAISDTGFVFDPYSGATFSVNPSGLAILRLLKEGCARADLVEHLEDQFDVRGDDLHRQVDEFIGVMRRHELVPTDFELA